jgi:endonuclease-3
VSKRKPKLKPNDPSTIRRQLKRLKRLYPTAKTALNFNSPFELLVATILSAQCTDARVNLATPDLFKEYPDANHLAKAPLARVEHLLRSVNFFRNKSKNIIACAQKLVSEHEGKVPEKMESLVKLPGVGRKTANCVMSNGFGRAEGIVVDTHVKRLAYRLGWTRHRKPEKVEKALKRKLPQSEWLGLSNLLIEHGRAICKAQNPLCEKCLLREDCLQQGLAWKFRKTKVLN